MPCRSRSVTTAAGRALGGKGGLALLLAALAAPAGCAAILGIDNTYVEGEGAGGEGGSATSMAGPGSSGSSSGGGGPACGDGVTDDGEECDDGNNVPVDGCSPSCKVDKPDACPGAEVPLGPGPGLSILGSTIGAAMSSAGTCSGINAGNLVYAVTASAPGTLNITLDATYGATVYVRSDCSASAALSELKCVEGTASIKMMLWAQAGQTYYVFVDGYDGDEGSFTLGLSLTPCGNGSVEGLEQCDDGNAILGDGCAGCLNCLAPLEHESAADHHCYLLGGATKSWSKARSDCIAWGGDLAALSSQAELDAVASAVPAEDFWTGGNDIEQEGVFTNTNGEPWFAGWAPMEPTGLAPDDCVRVQHQTKSLDDADCGGAYRYVCERAPGL